MSFRDQLSARAWVVVPLLACGLLLLMAGTRRARVEHVSGLAGGSEVRVDPKSPTGYANGRRVLLVPEQIGESYQWIAQTQQMLVRGEWRVRHVDYDNAPEGRDVFSPSPYRWWLATLAWIDHQLSGRPLAAAVERAALFADPLLHLLLLATTGFAARRWFGVLPAALLSVGWAALYPLGGAFLPGQPGDLALSLTCACWSVLPLLAGAEQAGAARRRFVWAGLAGGLGLWVNAGVQVPIVAGIVLGAVLATLLDRRTAGARDGTDANPAPPWRAWAAAGAITSVLAYVAEYAPSHLMSLRLEYNHPFYALAWWGGGELVVRVAARKREGRRAWTARTLLGSVVAVLAVAAVPAVLIWQGSLGFLTAPASGGRLSNIAGSPVAQNLFAWLGNRSGTVGAWSTLLPLLGLAFAGWALIHPSTPDRLRAALALLAGTLAVALGLACAHLWWWQAFDVLLLLTLSVAMAAAPALLGGAVLPRLLAVGVGLTFLPGLISLAPGRDVRNREAVTEAEVEALIERDLAYWLANQAGPAGATVLAPPKLTVSLFYHGGLRGLGTPYRENDEGFGASVRIAGASSPDEGQALARRRQLTHIVIPSWDPFLDEYARLGSNQPENSLVAMLQRWLAPRWLRPVPYQVPAVAGLDPYFVAVFQTVELQDNATALSRLVEYFLEMNLLPQAVMAAATLEQRFPSDLVSLVAQAQIAAAQHDSAGFKRRLEALQPFVSRSLDDLLPLDRRASLAHVLVQGRQLDDARDQILRCLEELDEPGLRSLSHSSLQRFTAALERFELEFPDSQTRSIAQELLASESNRQLSPR